MLALIIFSATLIATSFLPVVLAAGWLFFIALIFVFLVFKTKWFYLFSIPIALCYASIYAHHLLAIAIPDELDRVNAMVVGKVVGLPIENDGAIRFELIVKEAKATDPEKSYDFSPLLNQRVSVSYQQKYHRQHPIPFDVFTPGNYLHLHLKLRKPRGFVNPVGFDYQLYLLRKKLAATAYIKSDASNALLPDIKTRNAGIIRDLLRLKIRNFVKQQRDDSHSAGPLLALMTGDKQLMTASQWELFKDTGTIHLMVISGLHIGLVALFGFALGRCVVTLSQIILLNKVLIKPIYVDLLPAFLSVLLAAIYAYISGFGLPTQRALVMVCVFHFAFCRRSRRRPWLAFFIAMTIVLLLDPLAAHTPGFWLSFGAVGILLFSFSGFDSSKNHNIVKRTLYQWFKSQWVLVVGLGVPSVVLLGGVSVSGFVSNFIAIPIVSFIAVPLALMSGLLVFIFEPAAIVLFTWAQTAFEYLLDILNGINQLLPRFYAYPNSLGVIAIVLGVVGACYVLAPGIAYRTIALLCFLPLFFYLSPKPHLRLTFLDVGQGTAIVIETENHQMVYDTGKRYSPQFDSGADIIAPYLYALGYRQINMLMVSHGDNDHAGGVEGLSESVKIQKRLVGQISKTAGEQCIEGQSWQWDGVIFEVLWPSRYFIDTQPAYYKSNNTSCVLLISTGEQKVLLAGDIDRSVERRIINRLKDEQGVDIVLAPHHGSKTSSGQAWVDTLKPSWVVFTAGFRNSYGHPHVSVIERYRQAGVQILNTATDGAIRLEVQPLQKRWQLERWRYDYPRFWYSP